MRKRPDRLTQPARQVIFLSALCLMIGACKLGDDSAKETASGKEQPSQPEVQATASIFVPDSGIETPPPELDPLVLTLSFADGGATLTADQEAQIESIFQSEQFAEGQPIVLRGHSDAGGSREANMRVSEERANAVRDYLLSKGVDEERIILIAFGAQNPVEPNALPNGQPNEAGREANRRVELIVTVHDDAVNVPAPTILEQIVEAQEEGAT